MAESRADKPQAKSQDFRIVLDYLDETNKFLESLRGNPASTTSTIQSTTTSKTARPPQSTTASILTGTVNPDAHYVVTDAQDPISVKASEEKSAANKKHEEEIAASQPELATQAQVAMTEDDDSDYIIDPTEDVSMLVSKLQTLAKSARKVIDSAINGEDIGDKLAVTFNNIHQLRTAIELRIKDSSKESQETIDTISARQHRQPQKKKTSNFNNYLSAAGQIIAYIGLIAFALCAALTPPGWAIGVGVGLAAAVVGVMMLCKATGNRKYIDAVGPDGYDIDDPRESVEADTTDKAESTVTVRQTQRKSVDFVAANGSQVRMFPSPTSGTTTHVSLVSQSDVASATARP